MDDLREQMLKVREQVSTYIALMDHHDSAEGSTKEALGVALDEKLEECLIATDQAMRLTHDLLVEISKEVTHATDD